MDLTEVLKVATDELSPADMEYAVQTILSRVPEAQWMDFHDALLLGIQRDNDAAWQLQMSAENVQA